MNRPYCVLLLAAFLGSVVSLPAEDWTTINGKVYPQVRVIKVDADAVTILYRDGGAMIPLLLLPEELQKKFHYDPAIAKAAADARDKADFDNARALREEKQQILAQKQAPPEPQVAAEPAAALPPANVNSTHHSMGEIVNSGHSLQDDYSTGIHYSINNATGP
jgi:hypothetical protein